jgi:hypothetical protein
VWNLYEHIDQPRTTNAIEGWHNKVNRYVGKAHPNLYEFITFLKQEDAVQTGEMNRLELGGAPNPKKWLFINNERHILRLKAEFENGQRDVMNYLDAVSHRLQHGF